MSGNDEKPKGRVKPIWVEMKRTIMTEPERPRPVLTFMKLCPICRRIVLEADKWHAHGVCVYCHNGTSPVMPLRKDLPYPPPDVVIADEDYNDWDEDDDDDDDYEW